MVSSRLGQAARTATGAVALAAGVACACSVPVFRYALERWQANPFDAVVFYRDSLSAVDSAVVRRLVAASEPPVFANLMVTPVNLSDSLDERTRTRWDKQSGAVLPWIAVYRNVYDPPDASPVLAGRLSDSLASLLVDSPIRREIGRRLLAGETAVWLLVPSGDRARDRAVMDTLRRNLAEMEKSLSLPDFAQQPPSFQPSQGIPLRIAFSTLVISRSDPGEAAFLGMLFGPGELDSATEPVVIPMFGRGRALVWLPGPKVTARTVSEVCRFLTGPCACTVKEANPGTDMLLAVDWNAGLRGQLASEEPLPELTGLAKFADEESTVTSPKPVKAAGVPAKTGTAIPEPAPVAQAADTAPAAGQTADTVDFLARLLSDSAAQVSAVQRGREVSRNLIWVLAAAVGVVLVLSAVMVVARRTRVA